MNTLIAANKRRRIGAKLLHLAIAFALAVGIVIPMGTLTNPEKAYGAVGDKFTVSNENGVRVTYTIMTEPENNTGTVQLGGGRYNNETAVPRNTVGTITIPPAVEDPNNPEITYTVTQVGNYAFDQCTSLTSITIPDSVTYINENAFSDCHSLANFTIPNGVTSIEANTFRNCSSFSNIIIPEGVTFIGDGAYRDCTSLANITIPDSVTSIGIDAFSGCTSFVAITIPDSVTSIKSAAFLGCTSLAAITIPDSVTNIEGGVFEECISLANITIPDGVTSIWPRTFYGCTSLENFTIPDSVMGIRMSAFEECTSLAAITIPDSVIAIAESAFQGCTSLTNITFAQNSILMNILDRAFADCTSLSNLTIPASVASIGSLFISDSGIQILTFEGATPPGIQSDTFDGHNIDTIKVPMGMMGTYKTAWAAKNVPSGILDLIVEVDIDVTGLTVSPAAKAMVVNEEFDLTANVTPTGATDLSVTWSSGNTGVATVDANGHVAAKAPGTATITATTVSGGFTASCAVTVYKPVTQIEMYPLSKTISVGDDYVLTAKVTPQDADPRITWTSSNPSVATVSDQGRIYGIGFGNATITAESVSDPSKSGTCSVTVGAVETNEPVTGITVSPSACTLSALGPAYTLTADVQPVDATDKTVTWASDNNAVASVSQNGEVDPISAGTATITATTADGGFTDLCKVTVTDNSGGGTVSPTAITLSSNSMTMFEGDDYVLTAEITPQDADQRITWASSDPSVAVVSGTGRIYGVGVGNATITATSVADPSKSGACAIKVTDGTSTGDGTPVASVRLSLTERTMVLRDDYVLRADVLPAQADQRVTWTSDDPGIATVDSRGHIWATGIGKTVIKAASVADPAKFATCDIEVIDDAAGLNEPVTGITVSPSACTLSALGSTNTLTADVLPVDAANKTVLWESDDHAVASVSRNGEVYPISAGNANITATTVDGGFTDTCMVTVTENPGGGTVSPSGIALSITAKTMKVGEDYKILAEVTPTGADQRVTWASNDSTIVDVSTDGEIHAVNVGDATITATSVDDPSISTTCAIKVIDSSTDISPTAITLSRNSKTMFEGDDYLLEAAVTPAGADKTINWTSSDESVATVGQTGNITALAKGIATIRATSAVDLGVFAECILEVLAPDVEPDAVSPASLTATPDGQSVKLKWSMPGPGSSGGIHVGIVYYGVYYAEGDFVSNTDYGTPPWSALTPAIVKTTEITVPNLSKGKTYTFMVVAENSFGRAAMGTTAKAAIETDDNKEPNKDEPNKDDVADTVTITSITDRYLYKEADKAHTLQLKAVSSKGSPVTSWAVDKPNIATVSPNGLLTFTGAEGDINVTAKTAKATSKAKKITAARNVTAIATPQKTLYIQTGKSFALPTVSYDGNAKITPTLTWSTSNAKVAKVVNGKVTIAKKLKKGKATITAKAANGKALSIKVNVSKKAVKLKKATVKAPKSLKKGKTKFLTVKFSPKKVTGVKITFKSNKPKGLEVDKAGKLTAKKKGKYKITIKCGKKKIVKKITVK